MTTKQLFLNKTCLVQCEQWIANHLDKGEIPDIPDICFKIKYAGYVMRTQVGFTQQETDILKEISEHEDFKPIKEKHVSLIVMALEVMRLWAENTPKDDRSGIPPMSNKKLLLGKNSYFRYLLKIKNTQPELYREQKDIIEESAANAVLWYNYISQKIIKEKE